MLLLTVLMVLQAVAVPRFFDGSQLSSNQITSLCQDQQGYIWIGTEYGLNKFDGVFFTQYFNDDSNPQSLSDNIVRHMMTDRDGTLWVLTNRSVQRYNCLTDAFETVRFMMDYGEELSVNANDILQTADGHIWVLHADEGVFEVNTADLTARPMDSVNKHIKKKSECDNMYVDSRGRLWIGYRDEGLLQVAPKSNRSHFYGEAELRAKRPLDITEDQQHHLTIATYTDVLQLNEQTQQFEPVVSFERRSVHRLYQNRHGQLLMGTSGSGLWSIDLTAHQLVHTEGQNDLPFNCNAEKVYAYLEDRDGNQWIGCSQKGLLLISPKEAPFHFLALDQLEANNGNVLRFVYADKNKHVYICQEKGGITSIDRKGHTLHHWMGDHTVMTIHEDAQGTFWAGTFRNGMFRIDPQTGHEEWLLLTGTQRIGSITHDQSGNLYTAVFNDGLHSYTPDGQTERTLGGGKLELTNHYLNTLFTANDGRIWIGHYYGVDVYDPKTDRLTDVGIPEALRPAIVYVIGQSPKDHSIWIGSSKGLFQYFTEGDGRGQWKRFTTKEGLPNDIVCGLVITSDGTIWVSTYRGMAQIEPDGHFTRYYRGNGLQEWQYLRGVYAYSGAGEVIMGNQNGITYFTPEKIKKDEFTQGITLTGMRLGDINVNVSTRSNGSTIISEPLELTSDITVSYLDNTFSLRFSSMDFRDAQNVHYEYRFADEPADVWHQTASGVNEIFLSRLAAGTHRLLVRAYDNGVYSPEKQLTIHVTPPWYRSWGAYFVYLLLLLAMATLAWRYYWNKRQADINEEKIKFFVDISHELRSPLTLIKSPLSKLLNNSKDPAQTRALRNIERNTDRLLALTNQILSIRKIEKGQLTLHPINVRLGDFVGDICHDYDYQLERRKITLTFDNQAPDMGVSIDPNHFDKVVTNLLSNAIKYVDDGGKIEVIVRETAEHQSAELTVRDNGQGIDEAQLRKIFERFYQASARPAAGQMSYGIGLNLTQKIVTLHHGTITATNRTDGEHGSEFVVRLQQTHTQPVTAGNESDAKAPTAMVSASLTQQQGEGGITADPRTPSRRVRRKTTYHVAVVDDDQEICNFLKTELGETYHIHTYTDGQQALEGIVDTVPDLIISDVVMPRMDGIELLRRLKGSSKTSHIPVILLTTKTEHRARVEGLEQGADAYMDKPFDMEELEARIAGLIANRIRMKGKFTGMQEQEDTVRQIELKGNDAALMERIMKAVNARIDDSDFNVEALASEVGLSRVQLHRRMKELTGITVGEFIRNLRLQQAAKLLAAGDTTVAQVTWAVGFANPTHFSSAFKKHFGVTPTEYIQKHQKKGLTDTE